MMNYILLLSQIKLKNCICFSTVQLKNMNSLNRFDFRCLLRPVLDPLRREGRMGAGSFSQTAAVNGAYHLK